MSSCGGGGGALLHNALGAGGSGSGSTPANGKRNIGVTLVIPAAGASSSGIARRPKTISSSTQSVTVSVNGGTAQIFDVSGSACTSNNGVTTCTFTVGVSYGLDTFLILMYSGTNGSGTILDAAAETLNVTSSGPNSFSTTAGTAVFVTTNADSGAGSLRAAITSAASGVTTAVLFQGVTGTITLASPIAIAQNVAIIGPGASSLSISGGGATSLFTVSSGMNAVFYGLTLTQGVSTTQGGAIVSDGTLSIFSSTFSNNSAIVGGGAILAESGSLVVTGSTFTNNSVTKSTPGPVAEGGAIQSWVQATIDSSTFTGNSVTQNASNGSAYGGAIAEDRATTAGLTVTNSQFYSNSASAPQGYAAAGAIEDNSDTPSMTIMNDTFGKSGAGNSTSAEYEAGGGAIEYFGQNGGTLTDGGIGGNSFVANTATTPSGGYSLGGALFVDDTDDNVALTGPNTFTGNSATGGYSASGGAIDDVETAGYILIGAGSTFTGNVVKTTDSSDGGAFGGAISYNAFPCIYDTASIARGPAPASNQKGGGRAALALHHMVTQSTMRSSTIRRSAGTRRPMTFAQDSSISGTFASNTAGPSVTYGAAGGAIDIEAQNGYVPPFTISNATITSNSVTGTGLYGDGGGVDIFSGVVTIDNSTIGSQAAGNSAITRGGGVVVGFSGAAYSICATVYAGNLAVTNSTIAGNSLSGANNVGFGGGGLANGSSVLNVSGSTIAFNSVSSSSTGGGGIFAVGGTATATTTILNSTLFANTSNNFGGGMMNSYAGAGSTIAITNGTAYQNTATSAGGNIYNADGDGSNVISVQNSLAAGGTAPSGADIWNLDTFTSLGYNLVQQSSNYGSGTSNAPQLGDLIGQSPGLASSLAQNGGPTPTLADSAGSPGKGHIPFASGLCNGATGTNVDQRGFSRGSGGVCDVGAYEFSGASP
ncbi:MAG TPA: choice-of-anchor Q domain-containing protein [Candidatus Baltobacteraceae bacterium]